MHTCPIFNAKIMPYSWWSSTIALTNNNLRLYMRKITTQRGVELSVPEKGERHPGAGRPKGSKNQMTAVLKEAILLATEESQHAKDNGGGLIGYFT
jgi:hypothetical protein